MSYNPANYLARENSSETLDPGGAYIFDLVDGVWVEQQKAVSGLARPMFLTGTDQAG